jgi:hypothetical protein
MLHPTSIFLASSLIASLLTVATTVTGQTAWYRIGASACQLVSGGPILRSSSRIYLSSSASTTYVACPMPDQTGFTLINAPYAQINVYDGSTVARVEFQMCYTRPASNSASCSGWFYTGHQSGSTVLSTANSYTGYARIHSGAAGWWQSAYVVGTDLFPHVYVKLPTTNGLTATALYGVQGRNTPPPY